jgi:hypothetical protein
MSEPTHPSLTPAPATPRPRPLAAVPEVNTSRDALNVLQLDIARLLDAYEIDVTCHSCRSVHQRSIGWLRVQPAMECPHCQASIVLRTSMMNEEMRRVGRQLRKLEQQLAEMIQRAVGILGQ